MLLCAQAAFISARWPLNRNWPPRWSAARAAVTAKLQRSLNLRSELDAQPPCARDPSTPRAFEAQICHSLSRDVRFFCLCQCRERGWQRVSNGQDVYGTLRQVSSFKEI